MTPEKRETRAALLKALQEKRGEFVSGQQLAEDLGLSRTAVWKQIQGLREEGYVIEAKVRSGYRLVSGPERLYPDQIQRALEGLELGRRVSYHERVATTMEVARELAEEGAEEGTLVLAETQEAGRGRLGRSWASPYGLGLWFSLVLRPFLPPAEAPKATLLAAVAVAQAVERVAGVRCGIKWPNDLYLPGGKLCGILTELKGQTDAVEYLILGIGINVNQRQEDFPPELRPQATSLLIETGRRIDRIVLLRACLEEFEARYRPWVQSRSEQWMQDWRELNITIGRRVQVTFLKETFVGRAVDVGTDGSLVVEGDNGERRVFRAGDVTLAS